MDSEHHHADERAPHDPGVEVSRRGVLKRAAGAGALLGTAGCTGDGARENTRLTTDGGALSGDAPTPTVRYSEATTEPVCPPEPPGSTAAVSGSTASPGSRTSSPDVADGEMAITAVSVSDFIQYALSGTHPVVTREPHTQYVTVRCDTSLSRATVRERLALHLDGESVSPAGRQPHYWQHDTVDLSFSVSKTATHATGAVLVDGTERRSLSGATIGRLNDPPAFAVSRPSVSPSRIRAGEEATAEVRFTVENTCRGRGTFGASISGASSGYGLVTATLDPGERREVVAETLIMGRSGGARVALRWGTNSFVAAIPVVGTPEG